MHLRRLILALALIPAASTAQEQPTFSARSDLVVVHAMVEDDRGAAVPDLQRDHFIVYEDNYPQQISFFTSTDAPASIGLLIDNSTSMSTKRERVIAAATQFAELSNPDDEIFVLAFNEEVREVWAPRVIEQSDLVGLEAHAVEPHFRTREDGVVRRDRSGVRSAARCQARSSGAGDRQRRQRQRQPVDDRRDAGTREVVERDDLHGRAAGSGRSRWQPQVVEAHLDAKPVASRSHHGRSRMCHTRSSTSRATSAPPTRSGSCR